MIKDRHMGFFNFGDLTMTLLLQKLGFMNKKLSDILLVGRMIDVSHLNIARAHSHLNHCFP
jgi:hypothetical protein